MKRNTLQTDGECIHNCSISCAQSQSVCEDQHNHRVPPHAVAPTQPSWPATTNDTDLRGNARPIPAENKSHSVCRAENTHTERMRPPCSRAARAHVIVVCARVLCTTYEIHEFPATPRATDKNASAHKVSRRYGM